MAENPRVILHHYPISPFAEKIRLRRTMSSDC